MRDKEPPPTDRNPSGDESTDLTGQLLIEPSDTEDATEELASPTPPTIDAGALDVGPEAPSPEMVPEPPTWRAALRARTSAVLEATGWGVLTVLVATVPTIIARVVPGPTVIEGSFFLSQDTPQFLSAIEQGRVEGTWLFTDRFTAEPHAPALIYPLYLALGHLAGALGLATLDAYDLAALAARVLLWTAWAAVVIRLLRPEERRWAYLLSLTSGGFLVGVAIVMWEGSWALGASSYLPPSANLLFVMLAAPHWMLALATTLALALVLCVRPSPPSIRRAVEVTALVVLGLSFPFLVPVAASWVLVAALFGSITERSVRDWWPDLLVTGIVALPWVAYNVLLFLLDPFWSEVYGPAQNAMPAPPPWFLPIFLGVSVFPALGGVWLAWRAGRSELRSMSLLAAASALWMYAPVSFQRRAGLSLPLELAVLGGPGVTTASAWRALLLKVLVGIGIAETVLVLGLVCLSAVGLGPWPANSLPREQYELVQWIAPRVGPSDVVLAPQQFSTFLASRIVGRVSSAGAGTSTRDWLQKQRWVEEYFSPTTDREQRRFLERRLGNPVWLVAPAAFVADDPAWVRATSRGGLTVYFRPQAS